MFTTYLRRLKDFTWEHVAFHILCRKDEDYALTGGGCHRNAACARIARAWL